MLVPKFRLLSFLWFALVWALAGLSPGVHAAAGTGTYEAELPADLATAKDMCALLPCKDVFPGATHFSERKGQPPYVEAYDKAGAEGKLLGYVMLSTDTPTHRPTQASPWSR